MGGRGDWLSFWCSTRPSADTVNVLVPSTDPSRKGVGGGMRVYKCLGRFLAGAARSERVQRGARL